MPTDADIDKGSYREILALIRGMDGRITETNARVTETRDDAREARDTARALRVATEAQAIPAEMAKLGAAIEKVGSDGRSDLVNTASKITTEMRDGLADLAARTAVLETFKSKVEGAGGVFGWFAKNMPWLIAICGAALAALGWSGKHP
jgi:hypothetical protein